ncbi:MAG: DUF4932 domain-containing protein [Firmicutes bacterium]|nr:DUF4932 domain-containing protein [Bacillota bacterium]
MTNARAGSGGSTAGGRPRTVIGAIIGGVVLLLAAGGIMPVAGCRRGPDVWSLPPLGFGPDSPAAVADAYLAAIVNRDAASAYAVSFASSPASGLDSEAFESQFTSDVVRIGGVSRYLILGQDAGPADDGGEAAVVFTVIRTGLLGDVALDVYLRRAENSADWLVVTTSGRTLGRDGPILPPEIAQGGRPLHSAADRSHPLEFYDDTLFTAALEATESGRVAVVVSPKVELVYVVAGLTGSAAEVSRARSVLGAEAIRNFRSYADHPAVKAMAFLHERGLAYDALAKLASCFSDPPGMEQVFPFGDYLCSRTYGLSRSMKEARLLDLGCRLAEFYADADFGAYLEAHRRDYDEMLARIREAFPADVPGIIESYYGAGHSAYVVVVSGMSGNYALTLEEGDWTCGVAVISGCITENPGNLSASLWRLLAHEWSHTLVKPALDAHEGLIASYAHLYPPIAGAMTSGGQAYGTWRITLEELVIRAVEARMLLAGQGPEEAERALARHESLGFRYIRLLYGRLAEYEADRETYPRFVDFVPRLLESLEGA